MLPLRVILHPTDFSDRSDYAFRLACSLARDHGAKVVVLHVVAPPAVVYGEVMVDIATETLMDSAKLQLSKLQAPDPTVELVKRLEVGDPVQEIVRVGKEVGADMIVQGTHGRSGLSRLLLGSTAEHVLRLAECPVISVKQPFSQ
jgi:nucleotide-binding universal stress UspA family protein